MDMQRDEKDKQVKIYVIGTFYINEDQISLWLLILLYKWLLIYSTWWCQVAGERTCATTLHEGETRGWCGVIQYALTVCTEREFTAWLISVWRRMCFNGPGGPIPFWRLYGTGCWGAPPAACNTQPAGWEQLLQRETKDGRLEGTLFFSECTLLQNRQNPWKRLNHQHVSLGPARTFISKRWATTRYIAAQLKIGREWAKHMRTHKHTDTSVHTNTHPSAHACAGSAQIL